MNWTTKPTSVRRFRTLESVVLYHTYRTGAWHVCFHHTHHEVWPHHSFKEYHDLSEKQINRIFKAACSNGVIPHVLNWRGYSTIGLRKPLS